MSETKTEHSPGDWRVNAVKNAAHNNRTTLFIQGKERTIAMVYTCGVPKREERQTARLIAKAPEMLETLKEIADEYGKDRIWSDGIQSAFNLIAEIEREKPLDNR